MLGRRMGAYSRFQQVDTSTQSSQALQGFFSRSDQSKLYCCSFFHLGTHLRALPLDSPLP